MSRDHKLPKEWLTVFDLAWFDCSCGKRFEIPVADGLADVASAMDDHARHVREAQR